MATTINPVEWILETNWSYQNGRLHKLFRPILQNAPWPVSMLAGRPISEHEIEFRRYFRHPSGETGMTHIRFVLELMARNFLSAMDEYHRLKEGYDSACRAQKNGLALKLWHDECRTDIRAHFEFAQEQYGALVAAWESARHSKGAEIPDVMISEVLFPLSNFRKRLDGDSREIALPLVWVS